MSQIKGNGILKGEPRYMATQDMMVGCERMKVRIKVMEEESAGDGEGVPQARNGRGEDRG